MPHLLPSPVLSIGFTGHISIAIDGAAAEAVERGAGTIFAALRHALAPAVAREKEFFAASAPVLRLVTMGADGADLLGARAARQNDLQSCYIIPFAWDEYRRDFSAAGAAAADELILSAKTLLELPGRRDEGPRAYERADNLILSNIDLLLAVWDGTSAHGRAGTGDVVQAAVVKRIPVVVIDPASPGTPGIIVVPPVAGLEPPVAVDLARKPFPAHPVDFVHDIISPPARRRQRQSLADLMAEAPRSPTWRFEYPLLLRAVAGRRSPRRPAASEPTSVQGPSEAAAAPPPLAHADARNVADFEYARQTVDQLAVKYGQLFRSSATSSYLIVIIGVWISGLAGLLVPALQGASIAMQFVANAVVIADASLSSRRRWQERWLDYRVVAERLRWLGLRYSFGLGGEPKDSPDVRTKVSWTDWYAQRMAHALGPPRGKIETATVAAAADRLLQVEIPHQIEYHRTAVRQLGTLEARLSCAANVALVAALAVAVALATAAVRAGGLHAVGWRPLAIVLLTVLPATMTGFNGLRADADLLRLVERSAQTVVLLFRIRRAILAEPRDYDNVSSAMRRLAAIMRNELAEWRFVIESRRSRGERRKVVKKRGPFFGLWRWAKGLMARR